MDITLVDGSGTSDTIFWMILGRRGDGAVCWIDPDGAATPVALGDDVATYQFEINGQITIPSVPELSSARVGLTVGQPLQFAIVADGAGQPNVQDAVFWLATDPNYHVLWDKIEFTVAGGQIWANTTQVDYFSLPTVVEVANATTSLATAPLAVTRAAVFAAFAARPPFATLVVRSGGTNVRVLAPGYGAAFPFGYLDAYVAACWTFLSTTPLTLSLAGAPAGYTSARGGVTNGVLTLTDNLGGTYAIAEPTTAEVFLCNGVFEIDGALPAAQQQVDGIIKRQVGAALNRGVLTAAGDFCVVGDFYQTPATNAYSQILHASYTNGACYGFAYDDVCNRYSSSVSVPAATALTVTVQPF